MTRSEPDDRAEVFILVRDDHRDRIETVATALTAAGFEVRQILAAIGAITGAIPRDSIRRLQDVAGVESVHSSQEYLPPHPTGS